MSTWIGAEKHHKVVQGKLAAIGKAGEGLRKLEWKRSNDVATQHIRAILLRYGWNSTCYQLVNPGLEYWWSKQGPGLVGYVTHVGTRIVAGAPVSEADRLPEVVREFEADTTSAGLRVCYFAAEARFEDFALPRPEYSFLLLGAQPVWHPKKLVENFEEKASLREQIHRARNKGLHVEEWPAERATNHPELQRVLAEWLRTRGLPGMHFLIEPETLSNLVDRRIFVATLRGQVVGFINASPIPLRHGWLIEQFVRGNGAVNGTVESMLRCAAKTLSEEGYGYLTLGLSPLSHLSQISAARGLGKNAEDRPSGVIAALLYWARAHGTRFYNFEGLEFFKSKFEPEFWEPIYAVSKERRFSLRTLYAIGAAFTNGHPVKSVMQGALRAVRQEIEWLREKRALSHKAKRKTKSGIP